MPVGITDLVAFHGAVLAEVEALDQQGGATTEGVVEHDGAVVLEGGVDDGQFGDMVQAAAVGALRWELTDKGVLGGVHSHAVGTDGVALVDGEGLEIGVVGDEGLALVGVGCDGPVAQQDNLFVEANLGDAVADGAVAATDEIVFGIGLLVLGESRGNRQQGYDAKQYSFHDVGILKLSDLVIW